MNNKIIVFDCDGTLVDSYSIVIEGVSETFSKYIPNIKLSKSELDAFFGPSLYESFGKYVDKSEIEYIIKKYRQISTKVLAQRLKMFDGIKEVLDYLKNNNYKICILSNRLNQSVKEVLKIVNIENYFDLILGFDDQEKPKPNPCGIYTIMKKYNVNSDNIYMIGDTIVDVLTGNNANSNSIGVTWCKTSKEEFEKVGAKHIIDEPKELIKILEG